eukprot:scaffold6177_cov122-Skeletonema_dohrnii-CCMP3373.AAC.1
MMAEQQKKELLYILTAEVGPIYPGKILQASDSESGEGSIHLLYLHLTQIQEDRAAIFGCGCSISIGELELASASNGVTEEGQRQSEEGSKSRGQGQGG